MKVWHVENMVRIGLPWCLPLLGLDGGVGLYHQATLHELLLSDETEKAVQFCV